MKAQQILDITEVKDHGVYFSLECKTPSTTIDIWVNEDGERGFEVIVDGVTVDLSDSVLNELYEYLVCIINKQEEESRLEQILSEPKEVDCMEARKSLIA